jgi:hypothetical protein
MTRVNPIAISGESSRQEEAFDQTEPIDVDSPKGNADELVVRDPGRWR